MPLRRSKATTSNGSQPASPSKSRPRRKRGRLLLSLGGMMGFLVLALTTSHTLWKSSKIGTDLESAVQLALQYASQQNTTIKKAVDDDTIQVIDATIDGNRTRVKLHKQTSLVPSNSTVVTAYFQLDSKFSNERYNNWMVNTLSLQDCMVIYTSPNLVDFMWHLRSHAKNRTVVIAMNLTQVPMARDYSADFWKYQLENDPERKIHKDYPLFWIWLSKSYFVLQSIEKNFFSSSIYMWSDIGCFRTRAYRGRTMIQYKHLVPSSRIMQMAHHKPNPPPNQEVYWNDKYHHRQHFYHSGSQMIGYANVWRAFHAEFLETIKGFLSRNMFIGEDQTVLQSTCLRRPDLCAYVPFNQVKDNHYFGLRHVLSYGGNYTLWYPPTRVNETLTTRL